MTSGHREVGAIDFQRPRSIPAVSVVVPVHQGDEVLGRVLQAIRRSCSMLRRSCELIVVDDASTDRSAEIAAGYADLVIRLGGRPRGPAYARNRGFEASRAPLVAFLDADVVVRPDALARMMEALEDDPAIGAVVGTYASDHTSGRLVSEYRNLLRHVEHRLDSGETTAFSAGLALVRRDLFERAGMFDEWRFPRPQAEALEFGDRLLALGYRISRRQDVEAVHLKRWTMRQWIAVDLLQRGIALAQLGQFPSLRARAAHLYLATALDSALAWAVVVAGAGAIGRQSLAWAVGGLACIAALVLHNARLFESLIRARGILFALAAIPLHVVTCAMHGIASTVGRLLFHTIGEPQPDAVTQAYAEVGIRMWPPVPVPLTRSIRNGAFARQNGSGKDNTHEALEES